MFKIYDGREHFYQWDLDRKLIIGDKSITEVHFCNRTGSCSLLRKVYEVNGMYLVDVPNILLQDDWRINVYAYDANYTKHSERFDVITRTRPENYVYTEAEQMKWEQLEDRINEIEENGFSEEVIDKAVNNYLTENPIEVDLTGYATETYVDDAVAAIPQPDLSEYALKTDIPSTVGLATEKYVDEKFNSIEAPDVDLSDYYTKNEVNGLIPDVSGFITMAAVEGKGYQTEAQVNTLINTALGVIENGTY